MLAQHEPREQFVNALQVEITREAERRRRAAQAPSWMPQSRLKLVAAMATVVVVSMAIGGGVVAAAYQAERKEVSQVLTLTYESRVVTSKQIVAMLTGQLHMTEQQVAVGAASQDAVVEARFKLAAAQARLNVATLDFDELKSTGREPLEQVSAPLVAGRDMVSERWKIQMSVPAMALELEKTRLQTIQRRFQAGMANSIDLERSRTQMIEIETSVEAFQRRLDVRQRFLKNEFDAPMAELRVLEIDADQHRKALGPKIELAQKDIVSTQGRFNTGQANTIEVKEAELRLIELQLELSKADVELARIRQQIVLRRGK